MTNLATLLLTSAAAHGERVAVRHDDSTLTYRQLDEASARLAAALRAHGVRPGDRVTMTLPNVPAFPVVYYGILRAGAVAVPMNPLLKEREAAFVLRDSGARVALAHPACADEVAKAAAAAGTTFLTTDAATGSGTDATTGSGTDAATGSGTDPVTESDTDLAPADAGVVDRSDDATAVILYTSGTTGTPKGAELTHRNLLSNTSTTAETLLRLGPDDVLFGGLPLFHAFGQTCAMNTAVAAGATLTLLPRFDPVTALEIMHRDEVSVFLGVPTMYSALLHAERPGDRPAAPPRLRLAVSGGAALPVEVLHGFEKTFGAPVLEGYGLSETSPMAAFNHPDRPRKAGSIGTPVRGVELRLVADDGTVLDPAAQDARDAIGEIAVRGENVMKGYFANPDADALAFRDGWFHTGDLARVDEDGCYFIVDRKKDLIIRSGYNVYPREIEEVLYGHPAIAECAVVGVAHPSHGEEVAAAVVLRPGERATADEIRAYAKEQVAAYKYPRVVTVVAALPKGPTGKILKRELAADWPISEA
ncbi:long-chain-fatty-acid--CoA ligase [Streptomyces mangrovisoli]|uniref:Long-chain-fatty-acid--CoA ligase n=1 Tax=Streptomyces mangrovisoli TaxID=1428628 RepID=A0A1J4NV66_9ACTN|nr:long-chain fatty acid--CoA ligase [Streptomyces mangrovisoli]OIJ65117.1 long-chain-fatty-acid--CoA ligase [Streptomyces mangrovisoli]